MKFPMTIPLVALVTMSALAAGAATPATAPTPVVAAAPQPLVIEPEAIDAALRGMVDSGKLVGVDADGDAGVVAFFFPGGGRDHAEVA